jgi:hypothetical protein
MRRRPRASVHACNGIVVVRLRHERRPRISRGECRPGKLCRWDAIPRSTSDWHGWPDQRAAATAAPGPRSARSCGFRQDDTLAARAAWLIATGTPPRHPCDHLQQRAAVDDRAARCGGGATGVAPGRSASGPSTRSAAKSSRDAGVPVDPMVDRPAIHEVAPWADEALAYPTRPSHDSRSNSA